MKREPKRPDIRLIKGNATRAKELTNMPEQPKTLLNVYSILCSPTGEDGKPLMEPVKEGDEPQPVITRLAVVAANSRAATQKAVAFFQQAAKSLENVKVTGIEVFEFKLEISPNVAIVVV